MRPIPFATLHILAAVALCLWATGRALTLAGEIDLERQDRARQAQEAKEHRLALGVVEKALESQREAWRRYVEVEQGKGKTRNVYWHLDLEELEKAARKELAKSKEKKR